MDDAAKARRAAADWFINKYEARLRKLCYQASRSEYCRRFADQEDLFSELVIWIYERAEQWDESKSTITTYLYGWLAPTLRSIIRRRGGLIRTPYYVPAEEVVQAVAFPQIDGGEVPFAEKARPESMFSPDRIEAVSRAVALLPPRLRMLIEYRFGMNGRPMRSLQEVGKVMNVGKERVRQLEVQAMRRIYHHLEKESQA